MNVNQQDRLSHAQHDDGFVIEAVFRSLEARHIFQNGVCDGECGLVAMRAQKAR